MVKERKKIRNLRVKRMEKSWGPFHFQETTETFKGSTKMEISTRNNLKSHREKIGKSDFAPLKNFPATPLQAQERGGQLYQTCSMPLPRRLNTNGEDHRNGEASYIKPWELLGLLTIVVCRSQEGSFDIDIIFSSWHIRQVYRNRFKTWRPRFSPVAFLPLTLTPSAHMLV